MPRLGGNTVAGGAYNVDPKKTGTTRNRRLNRTSLSANIWGGDKKEIQN